MEIFFNVFYTCQHVSERIHGSFASLLSHLLLLGLSPQQASYITKTTNNPTTYARNRKNAEIINRMALLTINLSSGPGGGGEGTSFKRLKGRCRWMGSHFYDRIDHIGVAFSIELLKWVRTLYIIGFLEVGQFFIFTVSKRNRMFVL